MEEELNRQEQEKKAIENRLREKLRRQQQEEETKGMPQQAEEFNDAPSYYQPTIIPQAPLTMD